MGDEGKGKIVDVLTSIRYYCVFKVDQMQDTLEFDGIKHVLRTFHLEFFTTMLTYWKWCCN
jgi:adenylosuccinate synthase